MRSGNHFYCNFYITCYTLSPLYFSGKDGSLKLLLLLYSAAHRNETHTHLIHHILYTLYWGNILANFFLSLPWAYVSNTRGMFQKGIQNLKSVLTVPATRYSFNSPLGIGNPDKTLFGKVLVLLCDLILVFASNHWPTTACVSYFFLRYWVHCCGLRKIFLGTCWF